MNVLLVCMPFADLERPALGLSLLKAELREIGARCDVVYLNLRYARELGVDDYIRVTTGFPFTTLAGEWAFAGALWGLDWTDVTAYTAEVLERRWRVRPSDLEALLHARATAKAFVDAALREIPWAEYDFVGFTSFAAQNTAALALARRVKEGHRRVLVAFGGHNWGGVMGATLHRLMPFVDFAFSGRADQSLPQLIRALSSDDEAAIERVPGLSSRTADGGQRTTAEAPAVDLDSLPIPDHSDYFEEQAVQGVSDLLKAAIPLETSSGCWWATRRPCMFCGLNGANDRFSTKSSSRVLHEVSELASQWPGRRLELVDNVAPPMFLRKVLAQVADWEDPPCLAFRVRPDTSPQELHQIARSKASVMCGIESLDDHLLSLMNKGVTAADNLRFLERCRELGIGVDWNLLFAVPGESADDYARQVELIEGLSGTEPPDAVLPIVLERYSPFWQRPQENGFGQPRPAAAYRHIYPFAAGELADIALFFDHDYQPGLGVHLQVTRLRRSVEEWRDRHDAEMVAAAT